MPNAFERHNAAMREKAVNYSMGIIMRSTDWQEVQHALADHDSFGPWLSDTYGDADVSECQSIINEAEERLGDRMPANYG